MFKVIATDVVISKGYDGAPALKFTESGESVRFRIGKKVYDMEHCSCTETGIIIDFTQRPCRKE